MVTSSTPKPPKVQEISYSANKQKGFGILDYVMKNIVHNRARSILSISGVAICIAFFILFLALGQGIHELIGSESNYIDNEDTIKEYEEMDSVINSWLYILIVIISIIMIVAIANTMLMSTMSRLKEFGTLKAVGIKKSQILNIVILEALMISGFAFLAGAIIGIWVAILFDYMFNNVAGLGVFFAPTRVTTENIFSAAILAIGIGTLAALYPAIKAANLSPVEALKYE